LNGAILDSANLSNANFSRADLCGAGLGNEIVLNGTDFSEAKLRGADFSGARLSGVNFRHAELCGAFFQHTIWENGNFEHALMIGVQILQSRLERTYLASSNLRGSSFYGVEMTDVDLRDSEMMGVWLFETIMVNVNLSNTCLKGAETEDVFFGRCKNVTFENTTMPEGSIFKGCISRF
jgi:uncharacterized protein YjbI with pentapeptide repeats